mmetsp:Transcript_16391/g.50848  ORF Transcript_16391/g.50848 Transcript_16391/m.50848 type:complete len:81 (-) Transcript_16391:8-250(-)
MLRTIQSIMASEAERGQAELDAAEAEVATAQEQTEAAETWIRDVESRLTPLQRVTSAMKLAIEAQVCAQCSASNSAVAAA